MQNAFGLQIEILEDSYKSNDELINDDIELMTITRNNNKNKSFPTEKRLRTEFLQND